MQPRHRVISLPFLGHDLSIGLRRQNLTMLEFLGYTSGSPCGAGSRCAQGPSFLRSTHKER
jgi:hypothetical protein